MNSPEKMQTPPAKTVAGLQAPLVTVVIVSFNYAEYVERCLRSVEEQDYPNIQCIVVDCASTDNTLAVIEQAQARKPFFQILRLDSNRGHLLNALSALNEVKGVFVTFLDSDDFIFPEFVSTHVRAHLNDLNSAAVSVTDQIQVDAAGQVLAGTCHWHQKWRAFEAGTAWAELTRSGNSAIDSLLAVDGARNFRLHYIPAWWSSWLMERWIWSATSALMFRRSVVEYLAPLSDQSADLKDFAFDSYFARIAHSVGGTLVVEGVQGAYRRHGRNVYSPNPPLGGQTPNGSVDEFASFSIAQRAARNVLIAKNRDLKRLLGKDLYYSVAWQLMSNDDFQAFVSGYDEDKIIWEKVIASASPKL